MIIKKVSAKKIKDSRGAYTIEVSVNGSKASSPSGKSTGKYESKPYRKNIDWDINFINNFSKELEINSFDDLKVLESFIKKKARLKDVKDFGANALFAFESAVLKALAKEEGKELWQIVSEGVGGSSKNFPYPVGNTVGGGLHSSGFKGHPDFQEFLIIPFSDKFSVCVKAMKEFHKLVGKKIKSRKKNDEGAWNSSLGNEEVIDMFCVLKKKVENKYGIDIGVGLDVAASSFYNKGKYNYDGLKLDKKSHVDRISSLINKYGIYYIEDPLDEEDFEGFSLVKENVSGMIVGDDLTVTSPKLLKKAIRKNSISALIVKPNQNGSLLEVREVFRIARDNGIKTIMSHRSGETLDDALSDYAFGFGADFMKAGVSTKWREAKLKRMIKIEKSL